MKISIYDYILPSIKNLHTHDFWAFTATYDKPVYISQKHEKEILKYAVLNLDYIIGARLIGFKNGDYVIKWGNGKVEQFSIHGLYASYLDVDPDDVRTLLDDKDYENTKK